MPEAEKDYSAGLDGINTTPTTPDIEIGKIRFSEAMQQLRSSEVQAYIEANFATQVVELVKQVLAIVL